MMMKLQFPSCSTIEAYQTPKSHNSNALLGRAKGPSAADTDKCLRICSSKSLPQLTCFLQASIVPYETRVKDGRYSTLLRAYASKVYSAPQSWCHSSFASADRRDSALLSCYESCRSFLFVRPICRVVVVLFSSLTYICWVGKHYIIQRIVTKIFAM